MIMVMLFAIYVERSQSKKLESSTSIVNYAIMTCAMLVSMIAVQSLNHTDSRCQPAIVNLNFHPASLKTENLYYIS